MRVSTKAIKSGLIEKPPIKLKERKAKPVKPQYVEATTTAPEEEIGEFFSSSTHVHRLFKKSAPKPEEPEIVEEETSPEAAEPIKEPEETPAIEKDATRIDLDSFESKKEDESETDKEESQ